MKKPEETSTRVSKIASKVMERLAAAKKGKTADKDIDVNDLCNVTELRALAASCLTQTADK